MMNLKGFMFGAVLASALACGPAQAGPDILADSQEATAEGMVFDLAIGRPIGLVATIAGAALFVATLPLSIFEAEIPKKAFNTLVMEPFNFTFVRPLGEQ